MYLSAALKKIRKIPNMQPSSGYYDQLSQNLVVFKCMPLLQKRKSRPFACQKSFACLSPIRNIEYDHKCYSLRVCSAISSRPPKCSCRRCPSGLVE
ncbi:hypothetical protein CDAR_620601 [Caerostris darwini]|uniref:Uncharacterized protein n=1 Tax=Caerostris darwini TaxID=1538125 RepID=A0AAV4PX48_9ARAC|nr:hypothetical protein CDAR_620601 [Caerostris darwini]